MSSDAGPMWGQLILLLVLILVNAYFAAARDRHRIGEQEPGTVVGTGGKQKGGNTCKTHRGSEQIFIGDPGSDHAGRVLFQCTGSVQLFGPVGAKLESWGIPYGGEMALIVITLILSFLMLVLGELFPKRLAMLHADAIALSVAKPIKAIATFFKPFVWLLSLFVTLFLKICRQRTDVVDGEYSEDDVVSMLEAGQESGELKAEGKKMITSIFAFDDMLRL